MSDFNRTELQKRFDSYCKKVLRNSTRKIQKKKDCINSKEILFSDLGDNTLNLISTTDEYFKSEHVFTVNAQPIVVCGDTIIQALSLLPEVNRNIILLAYYSDLSDMQISKILNLSRSMVQRFRNNSLSNLRAYLEKAGHQL